MSESTHDSATVEAVARALAMETGYDFDAVHRDKRHWIATGGKIDGLRRDYETPRQDDYLDMARAAISAHLESLKAQGMVIVPKEPTREMWEAGRDPILHRDIQSPPEVVATEPWFDASKDRLPRADGHCPKGDTAVWVYRAMIAAAEKGNG